MTGERIKLEDVAVQGALHGVMERFLASSSRRTDTSGGSSELCVTLLLPRWAGRVVLPRRTVVSP